MPSFQNPTEQAIYQNIIARESNDALVLIETMNRLEKGSLANTDTEGNSLLVHAFNANLPVIIFKLLEILKNDDDIFFKINNLGQNLLHIVAANGSVNYFKKVINYSNALKENFLSVMFIKDKEGFTPLHIAVEKGNTEIVTELLALILTYKKEEYIDLTNKLGNTAAHLAAMNGKLTAWVLLANSGANMDLHNNAIKTPTTILCEGREHDLISVYHQLIKTNGIQMRFFMELERLAMTNERIRSIFKKLSGLDSLTSRVIAHLNFENALIRNSYIKTFDSENVRRPLTDMPERISSRLTHYLSKVKQQFNDESDLELIDFESRREKEAEPQINLLDQDRLKLVQFIKDIDTYIADLLTRPPGHDRKVIKVASGGGALAVLTLALTIYFATTIHDSEKSQISLNTITWFLGGMLSLGLGAVVVMILAIARTRDVAILPTEARWQNINRTNHEIADRVSHATTGAFSNEIITGFNSYGTFFQEEHNMFLVVEKLRANKTHAETLLAEINNTQQPLSLFFKSQANDAVIDIPYTVPNEETSLLGN